MSIRFAEIQRFEKENEPLTEVRGITLQTKSNEILIPKMILR
jgi:hypothetical protein